MNDDLKIKEGIIATGNEDEPKKGDITFITNDEEMLKLCCNGDILVKGKKIENDIEVVDALREFIKQNIKNKGE